MQGQLVLNMTDKRRIVACKECGEEAFQLGYCKEHQYIYKQLHNEKMKLARKRPAKYCECGTQVFGNAKVCKDCREKVYKAKYGIKLELKLQRAAEKETVYEDEYFNPKRDMTGIMANYNNLQMDTMSRVRAKQLILLKKEDGRGYVSGIF